jgi:hypothetical protein
MVNSLQRPLAGESGRYDTLTSFHLANASFGGPTLPRSIGRLQQASTVTERSEVLT